MTNMDKLIGWLHKMAKLSTSELTGRFDEESRLSLARLVEECIPVRPVPDDLDAEEFADWIHGLRESEGEWNRALGAAILKAEDAAERSDSASGAEILTAFATECPWLPLREIAQREANRHRRGGK
jgi:hypothetical protein